MWVHPALQHEQATLNRLVDQLESESAVELDGPGLLQTLTQAEICTLQNLSVLHQAMPAASCDQAWLSAAALAKQHDAKSSEPSGFARLNKNRPQLAALADFCWQGTASRRFASNDAVPACWPSPKNLASRRGMLKRYASFGSGAPRLAGSLFERNMTLAIFGKSDWDNAYNAFRCEGLRFEPRVLPLARFEPSVQLTSRHEALPTLNATLITMAAAGGVVVGGIGIEFNNAQMCTSRSVDLNDGNGPAHLAPGFNCNYDRAAFRKHLARVLGAFQRFGSSCEKCIAIYVTAPLQHFATSDGAYDPAVFNLSQSRSCAPRPPALLRSLPSDSPNRWRHEDVLKELKSGRYPNVLLLEQHRINAHTWDSHPGVDGQQLKSFVQLKSGPVIWRKPALDCLHLCYSPFIYEPLWRSIDKIIQMRV
jgi:hypothetical protein